jgi:hypothetical protein
MYKQGKNSVALLDASIVDVYKNAQVSMWWPLERTGVSSDAPRFTLLLL